MSFATMRLSASDEVFGPDVAPTLGVRVSAPLGLSGSGTLVIGTAGTRKYCDHDAAGLLVQAEAGSGGGQLALGLGMSCVDRDRPLGYTVPWVGGPVPWFAVGLKAVVTRTWGATWLATPESTYVGGQIDVTVVGITARAGVSHRASSGPDHQRWIVAFGAGIGF